MHSVTTGSRDRANVPLIIILTYLRSERLIPNIMIDIIYSYLNIVERMIHSIGHNLLEKVIFRTEVMTQQGRS